MTSPSCSMLSKSLSKKREYLFEVKTISDCPSCFPEAREKHRLSPKRFLTTLNTQF